MKNKLITLEGVIREDATVLTNDGTIHILDIRGIDENGYFEILIDATKVGGQGDFQRQSIQPYIGKRVKFVAYEGFNGWNFEILK